MKPGSLVVECLPYTSKNHDLHAMSLLMKHNYLQLNTPINNNLYEIDNLTLDFLKSNIQLYRVGISGIK
jgi:hypothetical protein